MNNYNMVWKASSTVPIISLENLEVVLGTLIASYKCRLIVFTISMQLSTQVSFGAGFSERQLHMLSEGKHNIASIEYTSFKWCWSNYTTTVVVVYS
jgi:hypothetical protein